VSQIPSGQQPQYPQYPQQQGYPPQGQYPQQYPAPYSPYQAPQVNPMAYAHAQLQGLGWQFSRAGMMLIITGSVMALCGLACGAMGLMPLEQMMAEAPMDPQLQAMMTPQMMKLFLFIIGGASLLYAVLAIVLGIMVRKHGKAATITAIVVTSLVLAYLLINILGGLLQMGKLGGQALLGECAVVPAFIVGLWQLIWLIQALRSSGPLAAMQSQMQMQYWQMMQMQQQQYQQQMMQQPAPPQAQAPPPHGPATGDTGQAKQESAEPPPPTV